MATVGKQHELAQADKNYSKLSNESSSDPAF